MTPFAWGLVNGLFIGLIIAAAAAGYAWRRFVLAERRMRQSERLAELGTLTGGLAHELKNPLSTISLNLQLLSEDVSRDDPATARIAKRLDVVQREAARLKDILDDFLRYGGKMELERKPVELNDLCEEMVDFFSPQASLQKVQLRLRRADEPVVVRADPKLIKQAVLNLLINALQAIVDGGEIILTVSRVGGWGQIDVTDTGRGMPPEVREMIFVAYFSTKRAGTGLGLAMTRRIVEEHNGRITVKSEMGKGTSLTIQLPLR